MNPQLAFRARTAKYLFNAVICVAACGVFHRASAQNAVQIPAPGVVDSSKANDKANASARDASERAERERISQERKRVSAEHDAAKVECYQKFRVNDCLSQARNTHNGQQADLKRQELSLSDLQRKRRGAEQLRKVEEKTSPERQEEIAQQRGKALGADANRQQRQSERATERAIERAAPVAKATSGPKPKPEAKAARAPKSVGKAPQARSSNAADTQARQKRKMVDRQERIAAAASAKVQNEQRSKDAAAHAASVHSRQKQHKKPPAATLPIPPN